ncbi:maleylpyruvate isomerase family mycothiol-dependent enzyme [Blastococcus sp. PRF04-17]|uniref:maleylpyruvate isomerase family mycothiol-dependent enzyme n=1 Tax=Blastococcus sp. PRF04-17 TaxID=2933797 RepID=UPI001FF0E976|nr:maleylpyruvate isomerase family mycothiol-dependent enzyme [Blastococcus sp. PRF04-17]UOY00601.1 maleylpyruvate isomerase family mycothiol-dependent enzyme [Blastococcus sp. PRF04-17]
MSVMAQARAEREELLDLLERLEPEQWRAPSLCAGWTVHDVVAHVLSYDELGPRQLASRFASGLFLVDRINALGLRDYARRTPAELVDLLRDHLTPAGLTAGLGGAIALTDGLIHQQDIRRPVGKPRQIPADRLVPALRTALFGPVLRGAVRVRDVRLVATDIDWTFGRGPEVTGTAEALLMAVAGRRAVADELSGPGRDRVVRRLG